MNIEMIKPLLRKWFPENKINEFIKGIDMFRAYQKQHQINSASSAFKALVDMNIPTDFLSETGGLAKNPVVSSLARTFNVDVGKIQQDISRIAQSQAATGGKVDSLESLKADLQKLNNGETKL